MAAATPQMLRVQVVSRGQQGVMGRNSWRRFFSGEVARKNRQVSWVQRYDTCPSVPVSLQDGH